jgi:hypothetical protein
MWTYGEGLRVVDVAVRKVVMRFVVAWYSF